jgi:hypothetical protein
VEEQETEYCKRKRREKFVLRESGEMGYCVVSVAV